MKPVFIAGPCVIESAEVLDAVAERIVDINNRLGTEIIFKASFDKANEKPTVSQEKSITLNGSRRLSSI